MEGPPRRTPALRRGPRPRLPASCGGSLTFADLLPGESVFLDGTTLVYHFAAHAVFGAPSTQLVQRVENQELPGLTSTHALSEAAHRLMTTEASSLFGWPIAGIGNRLRTHPAVVQQLTAFRQAIDQVLQSNFQVLTIPTLCSPPRRP